MKTSGAERKRKPSSADRGIVCGLRLKKSASAAGSEGRFGLVEDADTTVRSVSMPSLVTKVKFRKTRDKNLLKTKPTTRRMLCPTGAINGRDRRGSSCIWRWICLRILRAKEINNGKRGCQEESAHAWRPGCRRESANRQPSRVAAPVHARCWLSATPRWASVPSHVFRPSAKPASRRSASRTPRLAMRST